MPVKKKRTFLVTVGTSLLTNKGTPESLAKDSSLRRFVESEDAPELANFEERFREDMSPKCAADRSVLVKDLFDRPDQFSKSCAEMAILFNPDRKPLPFEDNDKVAGTEDHVYLVGTRTREGAFCAIVLKDLLSALASTPAAIHLEFPKYLGEARDETFAKDGLPAFLNRCLEIVIAERESGREVFLLPNGGYKTLLGYLTVLGLTQQAPVEYVYEDSTRLLKIPSLPLGVEAEAWTTIRGRVLPFVGSDWREELEPYHGIVVERSGKAQLTQVAEWLEVGYRRRRGELLGVQMSNTTLHDYLRSNDGQHYSPRFLRLAQLGGALWTGDQLTDMVDHASRHHYDLFELAERVLVPLLAREEENRIPAQELFVLLGALYLHDCGNVVGYLPQTGRMTEEQIRRFHPALGYLRLQRGVERPEPDWCVSRPIYDWLLCKAPPESGEAWSWHGQTEPELWRNWMRTIATLGVYHSSATRFFEWSVEDRAPFAIDGLADAKGRIKPLVDQSKLVCGVSEIPENRLVLLASLLRIIDALDQQSHRAGASHSVTAHLANLNREQAELQAWVANAKSALNAVEKPWDPAATLLAQEIERRDASLKFKADQAPHLTFKRAVREVCVTCGPPKDGWLDYQISLQFDPETGDAERIAAENAIRPEIEKEYLPVERPDVARVLERHKLRFHFVSTAAAGSETA